MANRLTRKAAPYFPGRPRSLPKIPASPGDRPSSRRLASARKLIQRTLQPPSEFDGLVVGLSGGLDSAIALALCLDVVGPGKVRAVTVDLGTSAHAEQTRFARRVAREMGARHVIVKAPGMVGSALDAHRPRGPFTEMNVMTRLIHGFIFQVADARQDAVVSTVDRSELLLGRHAEYFYGHVAPFATFYKTELMALAPHLGVPAEVLERPPGCVEGWLDAEVLGANYADIDAILRLMAEGGATAAQVARQHGGDEEWLKRLESRLSHEEWRMRTLGLPSRQDPRQGRRRSRA